MNFKKSYEWLDRAQKVIPFPWNQTFSKGIAQYVKGVSPVFVGYGDGAYLYDVDGNRYLDLVMGLMPAILGYKDVLSFGFSMVAEVSHRNVYQHPIYSLPHKSEVELSEMLCDIIPCAEMVRLGKNGSDATSAAVRLARAVTGRDKVLCCGYHGWQDWYVGITGRNKGVPQATRDLTDTFEYNNIGELDNKLSKKEVACVIMEPVNFIFPENDFVMEAKRCCQEHGSLLIFDEIITGFRFALGGAQEYFNVVPDLACVGKCMANGWPISAVVGKREYMEEFGNLHFSSTFGGETYSIAAALATINYMKSNNVSGYLWDRGRELRDGLLYILANYAVPTSVADLEGFSVWLRLKVPDPVIKSFISQELVKRGILWLDTFNLSYSHTSGHVRQVIGAFDEIFGEVMKDPESLKDKIEGELISARPVRDRFVLNEGR